MKKRQNGNILFIIIVAIGLLAALMMSLSSSERYSDTMDAEQTNLQLQEIYSYAQTLEKALNKVMLQNGCEISEVSFDHPDLENYNTTNYYLNTNSPGDESCHIFEPEGGGVKYQVPPDIAQDAGGYEYGVLRVFGVGGIGTGQDVGDDFGAELLLHTKLPEKACLKVNNDIGIENTGGIPPQRAFITITLPYPTHRTFPRFSDGVDGLVWGNNIGVGGSNFAPELYGYKSGCFETSLDQTFNYYYVLLAR